MKNASASSRLKIRIYSNYKNNILLNEGVFSITPYKYIFVGKEYVFSFVRDSKRFHHIKSNVSSYIDKLPYMTMKMSFFDQKRLMISNIINGAQIDDEMHLWLFIDYYFRTINCSYARHFHIEMNEVKSDVICYPQHGDCYWRNIFWKDNVPVLIDLDDVDYYPLFYDVFYYVIASKHENAFSFFKSLEFEEILKNFYVANNFTNVGNIVDYYLGAYVYFWVNKMTKNMDYHEIHFYLKWFEKSNLASFPLVSSGIEKYKSNLLKLGINNGKC